MKPNTHLPDESYLSNEKLGEALRESLKENLERRHGEGKVEVFVEADVIGVEYIREGAERAAYIEEFDGLEELLRQFFGEDDDDDEDEEEDD